MKDGNGLNLIHRIGLGIQQRPWRPVEQGLIAYGASWGIFEPASYFLAQGWRPPIWGWGALLVVAAITGVARSAVPKELTLLVPSCKTRVLIGTGDLFSFSGHKVVAVNEYFDSVLGQHVSLNSLHGKAISKFFCGSSDQFDKAIEASLHDSQFVSETRPAPGKTHRFPIGTTAYANIGGEYLFLPALARTDLKSLKASASLGDLMDALRGLWQNVRIHGGNGPVSMALMGSGLSGVNLSPNALIQAILLSILESSKVAPITSEIRICLDEQSFGRIDLRSIETSWSK